MPSVRINAAADGDNQILAAPGAGKAIRVLGFVVTGATTAGVALLRSGAAGTIHCDLSLGVSGGVSFKGSEREPAFICDPNTSLVCNNTAGLDVRGMVSYLITNA